MNVKKVIAFVSALAIFSSVFLTGCGDEAPEGDSSKLIQQSIYNLIKATSMRYDVELDMNATQDSSDYTFDISLSGSMSKMKSSSGEEMTLVAKVASPEGDYRFDFALKNIGDFLYVQLLDKPTIPNISPELFNDFVNKWWQIDSGETSGFGVNMPAQDIFTSNYTDLDPSSQRVIDSINDARFFKDVEFVGNDEINGVPAYEYTVKADPEGIRKFIEQRYELQKQEITPEDKTNLDQFITSIEKFGCNVWVDSKDSVLLQVSGDFASTEAKYNGDFTLTFSDINKPFTVKAPVDYEKFDIGKFFGAFMNASGMNGLSDSSVPVPVQE